MYQLHVYRPDGSRFEAHHCDGNYPDAGHDQGFQDTIWEALRDPEVGEVRIIKPRSTLDDTDGTMGMSQRGGR